MILSPWEFAFAVIWLGSALIAFATKNASEATTCAFYSSIALGIFYILFPA